MSCVFVFPSAFAVGCFLVDVESLFEMMQTCHPFLRMVSVWHRQVVDGVRGRTRQVAVEVQVVATWL